LDDEYGHTDRIELRQTVWTGLTGRRTSRRLEGKGKAEDADGAGVGGCSACDSGA